ncbi:hypothetical protein PENANT_c026G08159 [Penicillium antarcticum]|uniref:Rhodopsin domain-containing protein n=1 Tax=Penicillium antarcticum TaxID=416450 RepID=A0A1V6PXW2_9EURO|nr:hypothetical protein PENANT_c026G08159 [Penicillium antarcticum]
MKATGDFGPTPSGIDLAENQQARMLGAVITLMIIGTLAVVLRVYTRSKSSQTKFGLDDFLRLVALCFAYGTAACVIISLKYKNGWHQNALTDSEFIALGKLLLTHVFIYSATTTLNEMLHSDVLSTHFEHSLVVVRFPVYHSRVFYYSHYHYVCRLLAPLSHFWEQYTNSEAEGTCIDVSQFFLVNGIAAVLVDVMILCVPAPIIWRLQMPKTQRLAVISILLLGGFVCIAGITVYIIIYVVMYDSIFIRTLDF